MAPWLRSYRRYLLFIGGLSSLMGVVVLVCTLFGYRPPASSDPIVAALLRFSPIGVPAAGIYTLWFAWRLEARSRSQSAAFAALCALMCVCFALALRESWHELKGLLAWTVALVGALALLANPRLGDERLDR